MTEQQIEELADKVAARILARLGDMVADRTGGSAQMKANPCEANHPESSDPTASRTDGESSSSQRVKAGASPHLVAASLGHETPTVTLRSYAQRGTAEGQQSAHARARLADIIPMRQRSVIHGR